MDSPILNIVINVPLLHHITKTHPTQTQVKLKIHAANGDCGVCIIISGVMFFSVREKQINPIPSSYLCRYIDRGKIVYKEKDPSYIAIYFDKGRHNTQAI